MVCTIGFFDGVHRGHQCLIRQVRDEALRRGARSLLITFDRHPRSVFAPESVPQLLTTASEKQALLRATGVDDIFVLPFDRAMAALTAREFMQRVLKEQLGVDVLVIGYDHRFGRPLYNSRSEGFPEYQAYGKELGIEVVQARELEGEHVSSSAIRRALADGDVATAARLLGRPYEWTGRVVHGHAVGRRLGFPTANLEAVEPGKVRPARGVYAAKVLLPATDVAGTAAWSTAAWSTGAAGTAAVAMLNIGHRPTLDNGSELSIEANLLDFCGDLYGQTLTLFFIARLREERQFRSEAELAEQLQRDRAAALAACKSTL
ncbi:MAG: riboflavin biosynthesis protein RibF [Bacteroidaceae bacterium]|nr:riboflavin biosynthesis protein RibF [Bacteroidaceae bacterium]